MERPMFKRIPGVYEPDGNRDGILRPLDDYSGQNVGCCRKHTAILLPTTESWRMRLAIEDNTGEKKYRDVQRRWSL